MVCSSATASADALADTVAQQDRAGEPVAIGHQHGGRADAVRLVQQMLGVPDAMLRPETQRCRRGWCGMSDRALHAAAGNAPAHRPVRARPACGGAASSTITRASIWSEPRSAAAASASSSFSPRSTAMIFTISNRPSVTVPVLSKTTASILAAVLQHGAAAHQDAAPRQSADGRHHGGGSGQNQGAGAGDDQHRDRAQPVAREVEGQAARQQQRGQKVLGVAIGQPLHRGALLLGLFHQLHHARQRRLRAGAA